MSKELTGLALFLAWVTAWASYIYWGWKLSDEAGTVLATALWLVTCIALAVMVLACARAGVARRPATPRGEQPKK